jgi:hypothetical protein
VDAENGFHGAFLRAAPLEIKPRLNFCPGRAEGFMFSIFVLWPMKTWAAAADRGVSLFIRLGNIRAHGIRLFQERFGHADAGVVDQAAVE